MAPVGKGEAQVVGEADVCELVFPEEVDAVFFPGVAGVVVVDEAGVGGAHEVDAFVTVEVEGAEKPSSPQL